MVSIHALRAATASPVGLNSRKVNGGGKKGLTLHSEEGLLEARRLKLSLTIKLFWCHVIILITSSCISSIGIFSSITC